jgi:hypothetical protein
MPVKAEAIRLARASWVFPASIGTTILTGRSGHVSACTETCDSVATAKIKDVDRSLENVTICPWKIIIIDYGVILIDF